MKKNDVHVAESNVAPDASSGVACRARNEALPGASDPQEHAALTRRCAPRGGRRVHPHPNRIAENA